MPYDYIVILHRNNEKYFLRISLGLYLLSSLAFLLAQIRAHQFSFFLLFGILVMAAGIFYSGRHRLAKAPLYNPWLSLAGIFWLGMPNLHWVALLFFLMAFLEYQAGRPLQVGFSREEVVVNSFPKKTFGWSDFNQVLLKDGLLTLDFKNNRIFQQQTTEDDEPDADEAEFNSWCRAQLGKP